MNFEVGCIGENNRYKIMRKKRFLKAFYGTQNCLPLQGEMIKNKSRHIVNMYNKVHIS